jgi:hypothetical protein
MGIRVKGGMYCQRCDKPVMAQKTGHGVRNTAAVGGALATLGLSLLATKGEKWCCPECGGPCVPMRQVQAPRALGGRGKKWRCEKNGHQLDRSRTTCPIDGSPAGWR